MGYFPNKVKRRRHSWANNLGRKLVLLGAKGSHTEMFLCEIPDPKRSHRSKRIWRSAETETLRIVGWSKYYFLELPGDKDGRAEVSGRSMAGCTIKGAKLMEIV